jgi:hypothetical protein
VQRRALAGLFFAIALALAAIAVFSILAGGRAIVVGIAAIGLALWMGDLSRRAWP